MAKAAKKAAKKAPKKVAKKGVPTGSRPHIYAFTDASKIKWVGSKENAHREGSIAFKAIELVKKCATVGEFKKKAESFMDKFNAQAILREAVKDGSLKVTEVAKEAA